MGGQPPIDKIKFLKKIRAILRILKPDEKQEFSRNLFKISILQIRSNKERSNAHYNLAVFRQ